jgi:hypothetical protein
MVALGPRFNQPMDIHMPGVWVLVRLAGKRLQPRYKK